MPDVSTWSERAKRWGRGCVDLRLTPDRFDAGTKIEWDGLSQGLDRVVPSDFHSDRRRILDFGCGAGRFCGFLASGGHHDVVGYDPCAELIALAEPTPGVEFTTEMPAGEFALVWCFAVLGGLTDAQLPEAASQIAGALAPNGTLFLAENTDTTAYQRGIWRIRPDAQYAECFKAVGVGLTAIGVHSSGGADTTMFCGKRTTGTMEITIDNRGVKRPFFCRCGTSDQNVLNQVLRSRDLDLEALKRWPDIERWLTTHPNPLIVDAGANVGAASVWFALKYPQARIVAIEPEPSNFAMLVRNVMGLRVEVFETALQGRPGYVSLFHPMGDPVDGMGHAAFRTCPADSSFDPRRVGGSVAGITMEWPLVLPGVTPFIAKLDIEGAESDVFSGDTSWIGRFPVLIVELHDGLYPGERLSQSFLKAVAPLDRDFVVRGERVFSIANWLGREFAMANLEPAP